MKIETETLADAVLEFFELREKGATLASKDLEVLAKWQEAGVNPTALILKMRALKANCDRTGEDFPISLAKLEKKLKKWAIDETALP